MPNAMPSVRLNARLNVAADADVKRLVGNNASDAISVGSINARRSD